MSTLRLYTFFHLNLAYSSIEEQRRAEVVRQCYWPLLKIAKDKGLPFGFEIPGYTLQEIARLDPRWIRELRALLAAGRVELIGSGYAQLIGPLVPSEVNRANLRLGNEVYRDLLGIKPEIALVNEQAYSAGLVRHYLEAGYKALVMEWDNPARSHPAWNPHWRYLPQRARGANGEEIALLWNKSIAFQKFQRYAHAEMELPEYIAYLAGHIGSEPRAFPLYGNDVEIFDFRPGRFHTEAPMPEESEWDRIARLFEALQADPRFQLIGPSRALTLSTQPGAGNLLSLESSDQPIPVKKQGKYNVIRWAVAGRDDLAANTACWRIFERLKAKRASDAEWRELCFLWSSDFRTHITPKRWARYLKRLSAFERKVGVAAPRKTKTRGKPAFPREARVEGRYLTIETSQARLRLNLRRGLAVDALWLDRLDGPPVCGTLPHGFYDDISLGADWYTGHTVFEAPGVPKVTDLNPVEPSVWKDATTGDLVAEACVETAVGPIRKVFRVHAKEPRVSLGLRFEWKDSAFGSLRLCHVTLHPDAFEKTSLRYTTCNGGEPEAFPVTGTTIAHGDPVSFLVSARGGLGMTDGWIELGDANRRLRVSCDRTASALIGLVAYREAGGRPFFRLAFSAGELDDTRRPDGPGRQPLECRLSFSPAPTGAQIPPTRRADSVECSSRRPR